MKKLLVISFCLFGFLFNSAGQTNVALRDTIQLLLENDKMRVTEYVSNPGKDVCGLGEHSHNAHLTILVTDASVILTTEDGKTQNFDLKAGTALWSNSETHSAVNAGDKPIKAFLIEPKE